MKKQIGIFAVGSSFGEDNIGELVIGQLEKKINQHRVREQIKLDYFDRPGLYLLELMKGIETVHLIDAIVSNQPVGTIHRYDNIKLFQQNNQIISSHGFGLVETLALGETLACLPEKIIIHGIEIESAIKVDAMSEVLIQASDTLANIIENEI